MNSINPIGSTNSMAAYKVADDSQKTDATKKAVHHGHGGGHHRAEAPAPTPDVDPTTGTSTSSILDVTA
jgi:ribosomal protein L2